MADMEKEFLQAKHRLEEAQARDRAKERKIRTRRLIQEGAILEKALPQTKLPVAGLCGQLVEYRRLKRRYSVSVYRTPTAWTMTAAPQRCGIVHQAVATAASASQNARFP